MRIGIISDIHGNLPALQAVLAAMPATDMIVCAGDVVGYYPDANQICELLRRTGAHVIRGNHDAYVVHELVPNPTRCAAYRTDWTRSRLTPGNLAWLASLPLEMRFRFQRVQLAVRHASPWDEETYLYADAAELEKMKLDADDVCIFGHTHHPLQRVAGKGLVLNPGSVGQPRDYDPRAAYAVLDTEELTPVFGRVEYDVAGYQARLRGLGWDEAMVAILNRSRS